jgi:hypothetical protein
VVKKIEAWNTGHGFFFALIVKWMILKNNVVASTARSFNMRNLVGWHEKRTAATWNFETISAFS